MDLEELLRSLANRGQLVHLEHISARSASFSDPERPLPSAFAEKFPRLWSHQAAAIDLVRRGENVAIATGTASGKSLCFQLPVAESAARSGTALLVYPTKALAQDQLRSLGALELPGLVSATYDGDTDADARAWARRHANVILTNPDMLHAAILPNHAAWATFLMRLQHVVLDELHSLRGIFGTHVAHVVRRLRRVSARYGADPTFVFTSATLGNPGQLATAILGDPVAEITDDGSPAGERLFALWRPPGHRSEDGPVSANAEAARVLSAFVGAGLRTIAFSRSRKGAELVASGAQRSLPPETAARVRPYRGGYLPVERREIERELFAGELLGVSATNALELGIDVGGVDACILNGFPGTIASMWQQAGRAGRARQRSVSVLVAGEDALDQWLMAHPRAVFERSPEPAVVNPGNPFVLDPHIACAAYEMPLDQDDARWWGDQTDDAIRRLVLADVLRLRGGRAVYAQRGRPAPRVGLRTGTTEEYRIVDPDGQPIGTVDEARAFQTVHPGAVYLHQGQHYRVEDLDLDDRAAWVAPVDPDEFTQARSDTEVRILVQDEKTTVGRASLYLGAVEVTQRVTGYRRRSIETGEAIGDVELSLPETRLETRAFWYTVDPGLIAQAGLVPRRVPGTLHAVEHAAIGMLPLFTICDRWDVGGVSTAIQADTGLPTIVVYDGYPGGAGIAELGFESADRHLAATLDSVAICTCDAGCPTCVQSPKCGNLNDPLDKSGAIALLRTVL